MAEPITNADTISVTDTKGRVLRIKKLDAAGQFDLFEAMGASSGNDRLLGMAVLASSVYQIDAVPVPAPKTLRAIRANVAMLGVEGINAVADALQANPDPSEAEMLALAKNSAVTR